MILLNFYSFWNLLKYPIIDFQLHVILALYISIILNLSKLSHNSGEWSIRNLYDLVLSVPANDLYELKARFPAGDII